MEAAAALSSSATAGLSSCGGMSRRSLLSLSRTLLHRRSTTGNKLLVVINASPQPGHKGNGSSRHRGRRASPVDEFIPVLHARIRKVEAAEKLAHISEGATASGLPHPPPAGIDEWAEWERRYYLTGDYRRDVFLAVGFLQTLFMGVRPIAVIGALALVLAGLLRMGIVVSASIADVLANVTVFPL